MTTSRSPDYLTIEECSDRVSLSVSTIRRRIREGRIPCWQPGGPGTRILIPVNALLSTNDCSSQADDNPAHISIRRDEETRSGPVPKWKQKKARHQQSTKSHVPVRETIMPRQRKREEIQCKYFRWLIGMRNGVYFADGRSNSPSLGWQSLRVRNKNTAMDALHELDLVMAVEHCLAERALLKTDQSKLLDFATGRQLYEQFVKRPMIAGGPKASTAKRYRQVLDKFLAFAHRQGMHYWKQVNRQTFDAYACWLDGESYAYATEYLELNTLKQILKFFVQNEHLPPDALFPYPRRSPKGLTRTASARKKLKLF